MSTVSKLDQDKVDELYNKLDEWGYKVTRDWSKDSAKYWSEVQGRWIPVSSIKGFCPVCETPQVALDIGTGYCGYCGAGYGDEFETIDEVVS